MPACPPSLVKACLSCALPPSSEPIPLAAAPLAAKVNAKPTAQPSSVPRCSRPPKASGPRSQREAVGPPGRSGSKPAP